MRRIAEIAKSADVSIESVLRYLHGDEMSKDVAARVAEAIDDLGIPGRQDVLPTQAAEGTADRVREQTLPSVTQAGEPDETEPRGVESVIYEALRVEVRPVTEQVTRMESLFEQLMQELQAIRSDQRLERADRLEDVAVLVDLATTGWQTLDRRLGRVEKALQRLEDNGRGHLGATYTRRTKPKFVRGEDRGESPPPQ